MTLKPSARVRPAVVVTLALLAALVSALALANRAEAFVYWTSVWSFCDPQECGPAMVGRANLDGTGVGYPFIELGPTHSTQPAGVAVDAEHIYWTAVCHPSFPCTTGVIGRANLDGTGVDPNFITRGPRLGGIAVDADHLYWSDADRIVRANLDGTGVDPNFITATAGPGGIAVDANHVYWTNCCGPNNASTIGRANLDGTDVNQSFITGKNINSVAVDANHVYWTNFPPAIGRANLDGTEIDRSFIPNLGVDGAHAVAVDGTHVYWRASYGGLHEIVSWISRANLDGSGVEPYTDTEPGAGLAVDTLTDTELAGSATAARTQKQHGNAIVVKVNVSADERLTAEASGKIKGNPSYKLKPKQVELSGGEAITLKLKPKKAQAKQIATALKRGESATAKLTVTLSDFAAHSEVEELRVRLKR